MKTSQVQNKLTLLDYSISSLIVLIAFVFYLKTLAPTITWGDPAKLTCYSYMIHLRVWAANHALRVLIGWLWGHLPFVNYAYGQNLLSAVFASLTIGIIYMIIRKFTISRLAATLASMSLGVSHTFWWLAVIAESYSLLFFLLSVCIISVLLWGESKNNRWLYLFSFAFGLGICDHAIMPLFAPCFLIYFFFEDRNFFFYPLRLMGMIVAFLIGISLLIGVFVYSLQWLTASQLFSSMTTESLTPYWSNIYKIVRETIKYFVYLAYQFPGLGLLLGLLGTLVLAKRYKNAFWFLFSLFVSDVIFSAGYMYQRQFEIFVPSYMVFTITIGVGFGYLWEKMRRTVNNQRILATIGVALTGFLIFIPILTYDITPKILRNMGWDPLGIRFIPYRDNMRYFFMPDKRNYDGAARYGREVLDMLLPDAVILVDFTPGTVLQYLKTVEGTRPDVLIVSVEGVGTEGQVAIETVHQQFGKRPIYLTDYSTYPSFFAIAELSKEYKFIRQGHVFLLTKK